MGIGVAIMPERVALQPQEGVLKLDLWADMTRFERWHSRVIFRCLGLVLCAKMLGHEVGMAWLWRWRMSHLRVLEPVMSTLIGNAASSNLFRLLCAAAMS